MHVTGLVEEPSAMRLISTAKADLPISVTGVYQNLALSEWRVICSQPIGGANQLTGGQTVKAHCFRCRRFTRELTNTPASAGGYLIGRLSKPFISFV